MFPELFHIGRFSVSSYGVMMALAFVVGGFTVRWQLKKSGIKPDFAWVLVIVAIIGGILGAKIHYLIIHPEEWPDNLWSGRGLVWFGGMFGALLLAAIVTLVSKVRLMAVADGAAFAMATGYAVGRLGCFLVGDDYGKPTDLPWGMAFPKGSPPTLPGVHVHPAQLYEILGSLFIFALLVWVFSPRIKREGTIFFIYLILAGTERFLVEFVRTNPVVALGLTQQQWISIGLFVVGIAGIWWFSRHGRLRPQLVAAGAQPVPPGDKAGAVGGAAGAKGGAPGAKGGAVSGKKAAKPTKPAVRPTKPAVKPTKPAVKPTKPAAKPTKPVDKRK
jgi:phosphatidylglycerol:prolipoprotein diacylglycerol transferase